MTVMMMKAMGYRRLSTLKPKAVATILKTTAKTTRKKIVTRKRVKMKTLFDTHAERRGTSCLAQKDIILHLQRRRRKLARRTRTAMRMRRMRRKTVIGKLKRATAMNPLI
jgi:hypothetical protein